MQSCWFCEELAYGVTDTECATHTVLVHDTDTQTQTASHQTATLTAMFSRVSNGNSHSHVFMSFKRQLSKPRFHEFQTATLTVMFSKHSKPLLQ